MNCQPIKDILRYHTIDCYALHTSTKRKNWFFFFLAHLMVSYCGQWLSVVRRRLSTWDVYTLETQKLGHQVKSLEILVYTIEATFATRFWWNLIRMFVLAISRPSSNLGHVGSKTRSPGKIFENSCLHSRGHICDPILMKLDQNVCFSNFEAKFEFGSCLVKN